ncbi:MAG: copper-translocating P-type ATPase [Ardenticatenaceae bacterium]|nr:MAG: copper-translocating P-type ATPase [Ardenticatenaceae bacterium]
MQMHHADEKKHADQGHTDHTGHEIMFRDRFWGCLLLSVPVLIYSPSVQGWLNFTAPAFPGSGWLVPIFSIIIFLYGGLPFLQMAGDELRNRLPGMMTLISLAISVSFVYSMATLFFELGESFFWELVTLIDVMLLGHWLEMRSVRQASGALDALAKLMPDEAELIGEDGSPKTVKAATLQEGDRVLVRPGSTVPADGEVVDGRSEADESMITGESKPVSKDVGSGVIGGTVNAGNGSLRVKITAVGESSALSGIMRLVAEAQGSKSRTQLLADRAAAWLFYVAVGSAVVTAVAWIIAVGFEIEVIKRVVSVLVIACPHALGLAVPLVVALSTSLAASNGILVRDRHAMEMARSLDTIIFDKTGTLTQGVQGVVALETIAGGSPEAALGLASAIEGDSEHAIARAIRQKAEAVGASPPAITDFEIIKGRGVQASHAGHNVYIGGPRLLEMLSLTLPEKLATFSEAAGEKGQAAIFLVEGEAVTAVFALADVLREESHSAVAKLHEMGVEVVMLTGDSRAVAESVAKELGIDRIFAEVLPEDKDAKVTELQKQGKKVAMVGDGVNDAPALTRADVGIAIGGGTDVAVESAGIILVQSNPLDVVKIIKLSRASQRKMVQNIWWAAGYNIVAIPLAAGVLAPWGFLPPPALGALVMSLSTIIVAVNAQTLRRLPLD